MAQVKLASKGKRPSKAVSVLGIAGMSLAASTSGSPADIPSASFAEPTAGSVADRLWQNSSPFQIPAFGDEEITDVSLATFHLFDTDLGNSRSGVQLALRTGCGCGGCGGVRGCRGCGGFRGCSVGFRGCRGCGVGFRGCGVGFVGGCGWGGCGGCGGWGWGGGGCCLSWGGCSLWC
jgi:hypothetical protein